MDTNQKAEFNRWLKEQTTDQELVEKNRAYYFEMSESEKTLFN